MCIKTGGAPVQSLMYLGCTPPSSLPVTHFPHGCEAAHSAVPVPGVPVLETISAFLAEDVSSWIPFSTSMQHVSVRPTDTAMTGEKTLKDCGTYLISVGVAHWKPTQEWKGWQMLKKKPPKYTDFKQMGLFYWIPKIPFITEKWLFSNSANRQQNKLEEYETNRNDVCCWVSLSHITG